MPEAALTIDGTRYILSPLDPLDAARLDHWLIGRGLDDLQEVVNDDLPFEARQDLLAAPVESALALRWSNAETYEHVIGSDEGITRLAQASIRRQFPQVTLDELAPHFYGDDKAHNRAAFLAAFQRANTPEGAKQPDGPRGPLHFTSLSSFLAWRDAQQN